VSALKHPKSNLQESINLEILTGSDKRKSNPPVFSNQLDWESIRKRLERVCFKWVAMCQASCSAMCSLHWELREVKLLCFQPDPVSSSLSLPTVTASRHSRWAQLPWSGHSVSTVRSGRKPLTLTSQLLKRLTLVSQTGVTLSRQKMTVLHRRWCAELLAGGTRKCWLKKR
jgi:hypothetical protein